MNRRLEISIKKYLNKEYKNKIHSYLRYGRLPTHEALKIAILQLGEKKGFEVKPELRVSYLLNSVVKRGRIDAVWQKNSQNIALFEIEEGINTRAFAKLLSTKAEHKFLVMFDVKRMMQRRVDKVDFNEKGIIPIQLNK